MKGCNGSSKRSGRDGESLLGMIHGAAPPRVVAGRWPNWRWSGGSDPDQGHIGEGGGGMKKVNLGNEEREIFSGVRRPVGWSNGCLLSNILVML